MPANVFIPEGVLVGVLVVVFGGCFMDLVV